VADKYGDGWILARRWSGLAGKGRGSSPSSPRVRFWCIDDSEEEPEVVLSGDVHLQPRLFCLRWTGQCRGRPDDRGRCDRVIGGLRWGRWRQAEGGAPRRHINGERHKQVQRNSQDSHAGLAGAASYQAAATRGHGGRARVRRGEAVDGATTTWATRSDAGPPGQCDCAMGVRIDRLQPRRPDGSQ
jgi:hypothetical protein